MDKRPSAFFSYSWDGPEHEKWVVNITNRLRSDGGVDATLDKFELFEKTVNLNQMMIRAMRDYDYVIVVLTEGYAKKANDFQGGVGFESELLLPEFRRNKDKIILIMRHQGNYEEVFPFHLRDYYAIDFSNEEKFEDKLQELIRRIYRVNPFQKAPLGEIPRFDTFTPAATTQSASSTFFADIKIPNFKKITDLDKEEHLKASYNEMKQLFVQLFEHVKSVNPNFRYTFDEENNRKCFFKLYVDGQIKNGVKMWIGGMGHYSSPSINFSYGAHYSISDNTMNEMIYSEVKNEQLMLRMTMNMRGRDEATTPEKIVRTIWEDQLVNSLKM
ncbi:toll/interleukin-1 receptor domain-containing protein [Neobacillus mesonae]|uniref:toll/interleukin-1 receptor domain-containing protein n=1 Tax=Neobacillus mesonae TaxID=1193713 RepID=UPI00257271AD|nr:toll/interleukin-1 receptor domain-containing protein [Neobacillus mesonae]